MRVVPPCLLYSIWQEWAFAGTYSARCIHPPTSGTYGTPVPPPPTYTPSRAALATYTGSQGNHCSHWPFFGLSELHAKKKKIGFENRFHRSQRQVQFCITIEY